MFLPFSNCPPDSKNNCTLGVPGSSALMVRSAGRVVVSALACLIALAPCRASDFAESLFKAGQKAERAGDSFHAYLLYTRASALDPTNVNYAERKSALRIITALSAREELGPDPAEPDETVEPVDDATFIESLEARQALPPVQLTGSPEKHSFDVKGDARMLFERVAGAYGIQVVFEPDYQAPPPFTFRMDDATYQEALHALEAVSSSFLVPVTSTVAMVVRDTPQKRTEREPVMVAAIPIPERISVMEAQELIQAVQQTMEVRRIAADPLRHVVIVRDQVHKVMAARQILESLSRPRAQIAVDVEFLEADKTSSLTYGMNLPNQFSIVNFGNFLHNAPSVPSGFTSFLTFGGGTTLFGIGITTATTFATLAKATATNLLEAQVVALDGQSASLHVGQHYPIVTNAYIGSASPTTTAASQVFTPPPTINYTDLGLVLKITPSIHDENEVTLDVDAAFTVLGASTSTAGIPIISNRKFTGKVRLKEGEWAVIAGLTQSLDSDTLSGYPGVLRLPFLGRLLSQTTDEKDTTNVLLVLKPHVVSLPAWDYPTQTLWIGSDTRPLTIF